MEQVFFYRCFVRDGKELMYNSPEVASGGPRRLVAEMLLHVEINLV